jgi:hypothetical protein
LLSFLVTPSYNVLIQYELDFAGVLGTILLALGTFVVASKTAASIELTRKTEKAKIMPACYISPTAEDAHQKTTGNCPPAYFHYPDIEAQHQSGNILRAISQYDKYVIDCNITNGGNGAAYKVRMILAEQLWGPFTREIFIADILAANETRVKRFKVADYDIGGDAATFIQSITKVIICYEDSEGSEYQYHSIKDFSKPNNASEYSTVFNAGSFEREKPPVIAEYFPENNACKY